MPMVAAVVRGALPGDALHPREPRASTCAARGRSTLLPELALLAALRRRAHGAGAARAGGAGVKRAPLVERPRRRLPRGAWSCGTTGRSHHRDGPARDHAAPLRLRHLEHAGERAVGGARPQRQRRVAPARRGHPHHRLLPGARRGHQLRRGRAAAAERRRSLALLVIPRDFRRDLERGRPQVQLLLDGTDPLSAARVSGYVSQVAPRFDAGPAPPARDTDPARRASGPIDVRQRFWFNPTLADRDFFLADPRRHAAHQPLPERRLRSASSASARAAPSSRCCPCRPRRSRSCSASCCRWWRWATACSGSPSLGSGVLFGLWPQGSWLGLAIVTLPVHARVPRHRRLRLDAGAELGAGGVHLGLLHHAVVRALGRDVPLPAHAAGGPRWLAA